jgi:isoleucyl-tRNA synthetase
MVEADRYALALTAELQAAIARDYAGYQFHLVAQKLQTFCSEDLGAFYLDVLKDRLYTCGARSPARRSAQTALWHVTQSLVRMMAPILSFTAEEAWQVFTTRPDDSVFFQTLHEIPVPADAAALLAKWARLRELRGPARKEIEALRVAGKVGSSLQAEVELRAAGEDYRMLASLGEELKYLMLTSKATVADAAGGEAGATVRPSGHPKCERCWHYRPDVDAEGLCGRCASNLDGSGEPRVHV